MKNNNFVAGAFVVLCSVYLTLLSPLAEAGATAVKGDWQNSLALPPATSSSGVALFFGGHIETLPDALGQPVQATDGVVVLQSSSFGQPAANSFPFYQFQAILRDEALTLLYRCGAENGTGTCANPTAGAAFEYKDLLYNKNAAGFLEAQFLDLATLWTDAHRAKALQAAQLVQSALIYDPSNAGLRNTLLDIYYDTAVADMAKANEKRVEAQKAVMGLGYTPPPGGLFIDQEIALLESAVGLFDSAAQPYFELLTDPMGIAVAGIDAAAANETFGYYLFRSEVPERSLFSPLYQVGVDQVPVLDANQDGTADTLFTGYKDLVLLFQLQRDKAQTAAKLARLYAMRNRPAGGAYLSDSQLAYDLIGSVQQKAYLDGNILEGIFPASDLAVVDAGSGLKEARASWQQGLSSLSSVMGFLDGNTNPLGLDKEFLALVQGDLLGVSTPDSYDYFENLLIPNGLNPSGPLGDALTKFQAAKGAYQTFKVNQDTIFTELQGQRVQYGNRLREIVGAVYPTATNPSPKYATPELNTGGQIYGQLQNIELAKSRIAKNQQQINNLNQQIKHEIERRGKEAGINDLIAQTYVKYGNRQAKLTKEIASINSMQAMANGLANTASQLGAPTPNIAGAIASHINTAIQAQAELNKGRLQAQKEQLAAQQSAKIQYLNINIQAANSEARVKDLWLGMSILVIDSQEAAIMLSQEMGRLQALLDEKSFLEAQWTEVETGLAQRYFADPSHRVLMNKEVVEAGFAFEEARLWLFIMARALDYKWNSKILVSHNNRVYSSESVFALRNADELVEMAKGLWNYDQQHPIGLRGGTQFTKFSLREDLLGFKRVDFLGNPLTYPDPVTGNRVDAITAFQSYLKSVAVHKKPDWGTNQEVVELVFSTAKTNFSGTFFSPDRWNEKIRWLSVKINAISPLSEVLVRLSQSGLGLVRNETRGVVDPIRPDIVRGEFTSYPSRYWYQQTDPATGLLQFKVKNEFAIALNASVNKDPNAPASTLQKTEFQEMSPAVTKWVLEVPVVHNSGVPVLDLDKVQDIEIWFYNYYKTRN